MKAVFKCLLAQENPLVMINPTEQRQRKLRLGIKNGQMVPG